MEGSADEKKAMIWALYGQSCRVCDAPTDNKGNPIPPSRQEKRYRSETPEEWLVNELVEAHADYNQRPGGKCQVHIETYMKIQRGQRLTAQER